MAKPKKLSRAQLTKLLELDTVCNETLDTLYIQQCVISEAHWKIAEASKKYTNALVQELKKAF